MFGIKTKKDKRIEYLEELLCRQHMKTPQVITSTKDFVQIGGSIMLEEMMPVEYAKRQIAKQMIELIECKIHYDVEDVNGKKILRGYLYVEG